MTLLLPHRCTVQRHAALPYLFRASCHCGWQALASTEANAKAAAASHLSAEEAFPDWSFLTPPGEGRPN